MQMATVQLPDASKSCLSLVRTACRTRGGLAALGRNTDMRRHVVVRPKIDEPYPSGVEAHSDSGVVLSRFLSVEDSIRPTSNKEKSARCET